MLALRLASRWVRFLITMFCLHVTSFGFTGAAWRKKEKEYSTCFTVLEALCSATTFLDNESNGVRSHRILTKIRYRLQAGATVRLISLKRWYHTGMALCYLRIKVSIMLTIFRGYIYGVLRKLSCVTNANQRRTSDVRTHSRKTGFGDSVFFICDRWF